jgi:hypothetical protein
LTTTASESSDHHKATAVVGLRSDGQPLADFRFAFRARGQAQGWRGLYQFRVLSESGPHQVEAVQHDDN